VSGVWAAAVTALIYFVLGAAWFTPLFGRAWDRSIGHDRSATGGRFPVAYYVVPLVSAVVACTVIAVLVLRMPAVGLGGGALVGAGVGAAIAAASVTNALTPHTPRPFLLGAVTGGYHLVGCTIAGAVVGAFG